MKQIAIIGGGIAGVTAAALLAREGYNVTLCEGSREWGGSAGKFTRQSFTYPVGATLGMGFEPGGIHERVLRHLQLNIPVEILDVVMTIKLDGRDIMYYRDRTRFIQHLKDQFTEQATAIEAFFEEIDRIQHHVHPLMQALPALPLRTMTDAQMILKEVRSSLPLVPYLTQTIGHLLRKHRLDGTTFAQLIDGILLDSMQTGTEASALLGAVALSIYHDGAYYVPGGLYKVAEQLKASAERDGATVLLGRKIVSIRQTGDGFLLEDRRGRLILADEVIGALPIEAMHQLVGSSLQPALRRTYKRQAVLSQWATFTYYAAIPETIVEDGTAFRQVHDPILPSGHAFISLSQAGDLDRAPDGYRTLTMSCHVPIDRFARDDQGQYDDQVETMQGKFEVILEQEFPGFQEHAIARYPGGPGAWVRYTSRPNGGVGGYPQLPSTSLFRAASFRTGIPGLYIIGDTVFPGAGTIGATTSAIHVARALGVKI
ncbi:phytoene desaturase family protein [Exiguobacterium antarcticum]|uniref:phytoene desaturase family protein n=1 Tax=Exiguobacterium antarcticum TaxID=132920 RepID=UPI000285E908|nr:NAD(P)/FAD-dependent oxidoreductase [Exiguobacterium antarcticum]AFS70152.1 FAD dependent oxidoreductase [Exiguobacterium antarcticum B7]